MKLVVGLGNPGKEYVGTRHNIGFSFLDCYFNEKKIDVTWSKKNDGLYFQTVIQGEKVIFLKPQTFMNNSGIAVRKYSDYFQIPVEDILVISDDLDLNVGNFKLRPYGSSGGHNGLKSIESHMNSNQFKRLRIGISNNYSDVIDYVLGKFSTDDKKALETLFHDLCVVLDDYFILPFDELMNRYNKKNI